MSSTGRRRARRVVAKTEFFRIVPLTLKEGLEKIEDALKGLEDFPITQLVDVPVEDILVCRVPPSTSTSMASEIEKRLTAAFSMPVVVMTSNIQLCRVELCDPKEVVESLKGVENVAGAVDLADAQLGGSTVGQAIKNELAQGVEPSATESED